MTLLREGWITGQKGIDYFRYSAYSLLLEWPASMSHDMLQVINAHIQAITSLDITGVNEIVPGYHSIMIYFDTSTNTHESLIDIIEELNITKATSHENSDITIIEVTYGGAVGPDLATVAETLGLTESEVIALHADTVYDIHFIGFLPGFLYLGGLDKKLSIPRRSNPRTKVPAGSVALAAGQTGVYPSDSPGGWHIIGKTDHQLFNPSNDPPCDFTSGMKIQFKSI